MTKHPILSRLAQGGVRLGTERMEAFLQELGAPHRAVPVVHVAGTNGKGSVCALVSSILSAAGLRVGTYLSPHLQEVNERISVGGERVSDERLDLLLREIDAWAIRWASARFPGEETALRPLTYFEALTACAFLHFSRSEVDVAVVEVGLGGRLDATNVVRAAVSAVVSVGLDHTERLGPDLASVAAEKGGIMRAGVPVVVGSLPPEAMAVIRAMAGEIESPLWVAGEDYKAWGSSASFSWTLGSVHMEDLCTGLHGQHQLDNAAVALAIVELLGRAHPALQTDESQRRAGLESAAHPGRCEWLGPSLLADGAHNVDAAQTLAAYLREIPRDTKRTLLLGSSRDKDVRAVAAVLAPEVDRILTTSCAHARAMPAGTVAEALVDFDLPVLSVGPVEEALSRAQEEPGLLVVAGSLFLAGAVRDLLGA